MFCTKCGFNAGDAKFCPKCGNSLVAAASLKTQTNAQKPESTVQSMNEDEKTTSQAVHSQSDTQSEMQYGTQPQSGAQSEMQYGAQPQSGAQSEMQYGTQPQSGAQSVPQYGTQSGMQYGAQSQFGTQSGMQYGAQPQSGTQSGMQYGAQPQFGAQSGMQYGAQTQMYGMPASPQPVSRKKKKKWPLVLGISLAAVLILGIVGYLLTPLIKDTFSQKKAAVSAIKNAGSNFETAVNDNINKFTSSPSISQKQQYQGSFKFSSAMFAGENIVSDLKVDTLVYDLQMDAASGKIAGTLGLSSGTAAPVLNINFYTDGNNLYFKIPELFDEAFKVEVENDYMDADISGYDISDIMSSAGSMDPAVLEPYFKVITSVVTDFVKGMDAFAESCTYKKMNSMTYQSDNGDIKVKVYELTVTEKAVCDGVNAFIDALYEDSNVSSYMSLLSMAGYSRESLKSEVAEAVKGMPDIVISMYVNDKEQIVKMMAELSQFESSLNGSVSIEFIGSEHITDYIVVELKDADDTSMKLSMKNSEGRSSMTLDMQPDQSQYSGEFLKMNVDVSVSGNKSVLNDYSMQGNFGDDMAFDLKITGDCTVSEFTTMKYSVSDFGNAMNVNNMTSSQQIQIAEELEENAGVLKKIFSDSLYDELINGMMGSQTGSTGISGNTPSSSTIY